MQLILTILAFLAALAVACYMYIAIVVFMETRNFARHPIILGLIWPFVSLAQHILIFVFGDDADEAD